MKNTLWRLLKVAALLLSLLVFAPRGNAQGSPQSGGDFSVNSEAKKLPTGVLLVKGAWSSASDSLTPLPEGGSATDNLYTNKYFGLTYALPAGWVQKYTGPPPSDSGYYVLAQIRAGDAASGESQGSVLIGAQDLFFSLTPASNAMELIGYAKDHLNREYKLDRAPAPVTIANRSMLRFDYSSPVAGLHWFVLATQIRCHLIQFVFTSRDTKLVESLIEEMNKMKLPLEASPIGGVGGGDVPVCIKDYARDENLLERVDPVFTERRFNAIPVRIIIDRDGKIKHTHVLSAFPDQAKAIEDALSQWRFRPYVVNEQRIEVETGIVFGRQPRAITPASPSRVSE